MRIWTIGLVGLGLVVASLALARQQTTGDPLRDAAAAPKKVVKSDAEWRKLLSPDAYLVTRQKETEPAFSGKLVNNHARGYYTCVCCGEPLFTSRTKFDSGTGWPSFYAPVDRRSIASEVDHKLGYPRTEVMCGTCGAHLGHVFDDGPAPTGLRYCINSVSLKFLTEAQLKAIEDKRKADEEKDKAKDAPKAEAKPADAPATPEAPKA